MQPDLLSAQREAEVPESLPPQDLTPAESLSTPEVAHPEPISVLEAIAAKPALAPQKRRAKLNTAVIGLVFLVFLLFLSFGWVGYWAYTLNAELTATQRQLSALQAKHDKLQADYAMRTSENDKLNADLTQSKTDLEKANTDLATAQADLSKSKEKGERLDAQIDTASSLMEILYVMTISDNDSDILKIDRLVNESKDKELKKKWDTFTRSPSEDAIGAFLDYLVLASRNSLR
jgi:hypothetical protein